MHQQLQQLEQKIKAYQEQLALQDEADNQAGLGSLTEDKQLNEKITALKEQQAVKKALQKRLQESDDKQVGCADAKRRIILAGVVRQLFCLPE